MPDNKEKSSKLSRTKQSSASRSDPPSCEPANMDAVEDKIFTLLTSDTTIIRNLAKILAEQILQTDELREELITEIRDSLKEEIKDEVYKAVDHDIADLKNQLKSTKLEVKKLQQNMDDVNYKLDEQEQYSRRNCLLFHGIKETDKEDTSAKAKDIIDTISEKLGSNLHITTDNFDRSHRLGSKTQHADDKKSRPIIVKFVSYSDRAKVFKNKSKLKGTGIVITESLTPRRMNILRQAKSTEGVQTAWSMDGRIICLTNDGSKTVIRHVSDLDAL